MYYTIWELIFCFFLYSFGAWALMVAVSAFQTGRFLNPGLLNGPVSLSGGAAVTVLAVLITDYATNYLGQFALSFVLVAVITSCGAWIAERILGRRPWDTVKMKALSLGGWRGLLRTGVLALLVQLVVLLIQPYLYILIHLIPALPLRVADLVLLALLACDLLATLWAMRRIKRGSQLALQVSISLQDARMTWGSRLVSVIRKRLWKAFPELEHVSSDGTGFGLPNKDRVFAQGLCFYKVFWMFFLCALFGDWIETVYVWVTSGILMSRSSLLYGTFSVVWGLGGVLFTIVLHPLRDKNDRFVFLGGFFLGGAYEYLCSVFTQIVFGTVFWDYSDMPFNIQGRTNLLFMFFWGVLALVWVKWIDPPLNKGIEKLPPVFGTVLTWVVVVLMVLNIGLTALALSRYTARAEGNASVSSVGAFLDNQYPDSLIERVWPNMQFPAGAS